eukprot:gnl/TRDRNA2_/TRDRNA2_153419_c0_seq1.p1 gnl/TRDRNA2_/TRDRNA2_153419_c0~~gnl/TRDRNA2_/TRDRNA2_153419_c0_seq1.p1  ORF type:complete len:538 (-),score=94.99 gnl/TRDRNA2_/TRDRNA2_153419_c0_seq1:152-1765(-)
MRQLALHGGAQWRLATYAALVFHAATGIRVHKKGTETKKLHMLFVTDCKAYTAVQSYFLLHSARAVGHTEPIDWLRICNDQDVYQLPVEPSKIYPGVKVRTEMPEKSTMAVLKDYVYAVKALSLPRWLEWRRDLSDDTELLFLDGDQLFLKRFDTFGFLGNGTGLAARYLCGADWARVLEPNSPDRMRVCGAEAPHQSLCAKMTKDEAKQKYEVGMPIQLQKRDWAKLGVRWHTVLGEGFGTKDQDLRKALQSYEAEMYAFQLAAAAENITFHVSTHLMAGDVKTGNEEAWDLVKSAMESDGPGMDTCLTGELPKTSAIPTWLHLASGPWVHGDWYFSKYQVPPKWHGAPLWHGDSTVGLVECDSPLLAVPPASLLQTATLAPNVRNYFSDDPHRPRDRLEQWSQGRFQAWGICTVLNLMNAGLKAVKAARGCPASTANNNLRLRMHPTDAWRNDLVVCSGDNSCEMPGDVSRQRTLAWQKEHKIRVDFSVFLDKDFKQVREWCDDTPSRCQYILDTANRNRFVDEILKGGDQSMGF